MGKTSYLKYILLITVSGIIFLLASGSVFSFGNSGVEDSKADKLVITNLYDNYEFTEGLKTDWGFAALIHVGDKTILFDTGTKGNLLLENIDALGLKPQNVDAVLLSHDHRDHTRGLKDFLDKWGAQKVYVPQSFAPKFKSIIGDKAEVIEVKGSVEIFPGVYSTGEIGTSIIEQGLIIETSKGIIVITGCAHPNIVDIVERSKELRNKDVYLVLGGFHLLERSDDEMAEVIKAFRTMGVKKVSPTHCTGDRQIELFEKEFGEDFIRNGVGKKIIITE